MMRILAVVMFCLVRRNTPSFGCQNLAVLVLMPVLLPWRYTPIRISCLLNTRLGNGPLKMCTH